MSSLERDNSIRRPKVLVGVSVALLIAATIFLTARALWTPVLTSREHVRLTLFAMIPFGAICLMLAVARRDSVALKWLVMAGATVGLTLAVVAPPANSNDLSAYTFYGRILVTHHVSPYTHVPNDFQSDPFLKYVQPIWRNTGSVYGPLFTGMSAGIVGVAGQSQLATRLLFQLLAALAVLLGLILLLREKTGAISLALVGVNPLVLILFVNSAHNDLLVGLLLLVAALEYRRGKPVLVALGIAAATLIKITAIIPGIALITIMLLRRQFKFAITSGMASLAVITLGYLIAGGTAALHPLKSASKLVAFSIWERHTQLAISMHANPGGDLAPAQPVRFSIVAALVALSIGVALIGWSGRPSLAMSTAALTFLLGAPYVLPWYSAWIIFLIALELDATVILITFAHVLAIGAIYLIALSPLKNGAEWYRLAHNRGQVELIPAALLALLCLRSIAGRVAATIKRRERIQ
ncbi:MAG: putative hexosyltransferase [Actinomycetota bacterium]